MIFSLLILSLFTTFVQRALISASVGVRWRELVSGRSSAVARTLRSGDPGCEYCRLNTASPAGITIETELGKYLELRYSDRADR